MTAPFGDVQHVYFCCQPIAAVPPANWATSVPTDCVAANRIERQERPLGPVEMTYQPITPSSGRSGRHQLRIRHDGPQLGSRHDPPLVHSFTARSDDRPLRAGIDRDHPGGRPDDRRRLRVRPAPGSQNAADFAALAGARVVAEFVSGDTTNGNDANVTAAITAAIQANGDTPITFGAPSGPIYITTSGTPNGFVGTMADGKIPAGTAGVSVGTSKSWRPFFLGVIGCRQLDGQLRRHGKGRLVAGRPPWRRVSCRRLEGDISTPTRSARVTSARRRIARPSHLTPGSLNVPGGFGWLKFGAAGKCTGFGLGHDQRRLRQLQAVPAVRDRAAREQLRLLHRGRPRRRSRPTGSAACPATRRAPTAATTSTTTSPSSSRSGTSQAGPARTPGITSSASPGCSSRRATAARTSRASFDS